MNDTSIKFNTIEDLRNSLLSPGHVNPLYYEKMFHPMPVMPCVKNRGEWLLNQAKGKIVLDIGCTGTISHAIKDAAKKYYGVDQEPCDGCVVIDLDNHPEQLPVYEDVELIILSEFLEHLANPGNFLKFLKMRYPGKEIIITVPNAGAFMVKDNCEIVNRFHVAWYSYTTLKTLLTRYDYKIEKAHWYNGQPYKAEGIIVEARG